MKIELGKWIHRNSPLKSADVSLSADSSSPRKNPLDEIRITRRAELLAAAGVIFSPLVAACVPTSPPKDSEVLSATVVPTSSSTKPESKATVVKPATKTEVPKEAVVLEQDAQKILPTPDLRPVQKLVTPQSNKETSRNGEITDSKNILAGESTPLPGYSRIKKPEYSLDYPTDAKIESYDDDILISGKDYSTKITVFPAKGKLLEEFADPIRANLEKSGKKVIYIPESLSQGYNTEMIQIALPATSDSEVTIVDLIYFSPDKTKIYWMRQENRKESASKNIRISGSFIFTSSSKQEEMVKKIQPTPDLRPAPTTAPAKSPTTAPAGAPTTPAAIEPRGISGVPTQVAATERQPDKMPPSPYGTTAPAPARSPEPAPVKVDYGPSKNWPEYVSNQIPISYRLPQEWKRYVPDGDFFHNGKKTAGVSIRKLEIKKEWRKLENYVQDKINEINQGSDPHRILGKKEVKIGGQQGVRIDYDYLPMPGNFNVVLYGVRNPKSTQVKCTEVLTLVHDQIYDFYFFGAQSKETDYADDQEYPTFEEMLKTVKFLK